LAEVVVKFMSNTSKNRIQDLFTLCFAKCFVSCMWKKRKKCEPNKFLDVWIKIHGEWYIMTQTKQNRQNSPMNFNDKTRVVCDLTIQM
jgi:hypothetical protein